MTATPAEVYIVTSGCYSDYKIRRVFLDEAEADRFVEVMNATNLGGVYDEFVVETWTAGQPRQDDDGDRCAYEWTPHRGFEEDYDPYSYTVPDGAKAHIVETGPDRSPGTRRTTCAR